MPVVDVTAQNEWLDAGLGPNRATHMPDSYSFELWDGDPRDAGSAELGTDGGYVAQTIDADDWGPASGGQTTATVAAVFPDPTDEWSDTATHFVMRHPVTAGIAFCAPLGEPLDVTGAGDGPRITPTVFFADPD